MGQQDMFTEARPYYQQAIVAKLGHQEVFGTVEVALVFQVSESTVREWIEEGRLAAADLNAGRSVPVDRERPGRGGVKPMRPYYRVTREAILSLAKRMEDGV